MSQTKQHPFGIRIEGGRSEGPPNSGKVFADGVYEAEAFNGFHRDFVEANRRAIAEEQGMTWEGGIARYFPRVESFWRLTDSDIDNYYRKAYSFKDRDGHRKYVETERKKWVGGKSAAMKGSDAIVPHMFIPGKVGRALEGQFPEVFSNIYANHKALSFLEGLMPDWAIVRQYGQGRRS